MHIYLHSDFLIIADGLWRSWWETACNKQINNMRSSCNPQG